MKDRIIGFLALNAFTIGPMILIIVCLVLLTGCNTIAGMGTDIQKSANWTAEKMSGSKTDSQKKSN
jgi:predicted small secreted protein